MAVAKPAAQDLAPDLGAIAQRLVFELELAAGEAEKCQEAVSDLVRDGQADGIVLRLQALDALTQHLVELAGLMGRMSDPDAQHDFQGLLRDIKLSAMKRRLSGLAPAAAEADNPSSGELDLW